MKLKYWQETFLSWFMSLGIPYALIWLGVIVLPTYHSSSVVNFTNFIHVVLGAYLVILVLVNFNKVVYTDTSCKTMMQRTKVIPETGSTECANCLIICPPRSYHCRKCGLCIDRRDHHCLFTGCCVGRRNHRYFIAGVLAVFLGALYGIIYEWNMVVAVCGGYSLWLPLQMTAPHLTAPLGLLSGWGFIVCAHHMLGIAVLANSGYLVYIQFSALLHGQTQYDRKHNITRFDRGWRDNLRMVLGERWLLVLVWPFAESPLLQESDDGQRQESDGSACCDSVEMCDLGIGDDQLKRRKAVDGDAFGVSSDSR